MNLLATEPKTFVMLMISSCSKTSLIVTNIRYRNCHERLSPGERDGLAPSYKSLRHPKDQASGTKLCFPAFRLQISEREGANFRENWQNLCDE